MNPQILLIMRLRCDEELIKNLATKQEFD